MTPADRDQMLADDWRRLMDSCNVPNGPARSDAYDRLVDAYAERHRYYHNLDHIFWMLNILLLDVAYSDPFGDLDPTNIRLAVWYHDFIYDPRRNDNEVRSADLCRRELAGLGVTHDRIERACDMILLTAGHDGCGADTESQVFLDLDLSILGAPPNTYKSYSSAIRKEYDFVEASHYCRGRSQVLRGFLNRARIFRSGWLDHLEAPAHANITAEMGELESELRRLP